MITLIQNADIYAPQKQEAREMLLMNDKIIQIGNINTTALLKSGMDINVIDAKNHIVTPGFIDPHMHFIGGGGENGYASRTPEVMLSTLVEAGITTAVGLLGTDGTTRHMESLLAKARGLEDEGITTYIYSGNYDVETPTLFKNVKDDIILIDKVIGAGEIAIADSRSSAPTFDELARLVSHARVGGMLSNKCGVTHFHVGPGKEYLSLLHKLIDDTEIPAQNIYATHITRSIALLDDAIRLAHKGAYVDMTCEHSTVDYLKYYVEHGGNLSHLTLSSDGNGSLPKFNKDGQLVGFGVAKPLTLLQTFRYSVMADVLSLEDALRLVTSNTRDVLKLQGKGQLKVGFDADVLMFERKNLTLSQVFAKGKQLMYNQQIIVKGTFE